MTITGMITGVMILISGTFILTSIGDDLYNSRRDQVLQDSARATLAAQRLVAYTGADRDRLVDELSGRLRAPEDVDDVDGERHIGQRGVSLLAEHDRFEHLLGVADTEPARVRALLGALGQEMNKGTEQLQRLKNSLNPLSRFDFGVLSILTHARKWQAKDRAGHETVSTS